MKPSLLLTLSPYLSGYPLVSVYRSGPGYTHKEVWSHDAPEWATRVLGLTLNKNGE